MKMIVQSKRDGFEMEETNKPSPDSDHNDFNAWTPRAKTLKRGRDASKKWERHHCQGPDRDRRRVFPVGEVQGLQSR